MTTRPRILIRAISLLAAAAPLPLLAAEVPAKVTFNDHILPIFRNACLNCHNPDKKKAGLDLSTYQATLAGSDNGKVVDSGNAGASLLFKCVKGTEEPKMPPKGDMLGDSELAIVEKWIAGQLLESATSKGVAVANSVQVAVVSLERPAGPPPMPATDLPLEPTLRTKGSTALVALAASPWAPLVAIGGQKQVILYETEKLQPLGILPFPEGFPAIVRFSRNGQLLLTGGGLGGKSGKVVLWDIRTGERAGEVGNEFDQVLGADLSPDHAHVALGGPGKLLKIYSTKDGRLEHSLKKHTDWVTAVAFSPDGKHLASADRNGGVVVWEGATGKEFNTLAGHKVMVTALAFMPGVLASASEDGTVILWDVKEGKEIRKWNAHKDGVTWVEFTPDGRLVTSGRDKVAKVWDQTGKNLMTSEPCGEMALRAALTGDAVIAGDWSGAVRVFRVADGKAAGELTANPPGIAEQLKAATQRLAEAQASLPALKAAMEESEAKWKAEKAALDVGQPTDSQKAATEANQKRVADLEAKLNAANAEVTKLREARGKLKEGTPEYATAHEKVQVAKKDAATAQAAFDEGKKSLTAPPPPVAEQAYAKAREAYDAAAAKAAQGASEVERWKRAEAFMAVHSAREALRELKAKHEGSVETAKDALRPVEIMQAEIASLEKSIAEAPTALQPREKAVEEAKAALAPLEKAVTAAEAAVKEKETALSLGEQKIANAAAAVPELEKTLARQNNELAELRKAREGKTAGTPEHAEADTKVQAKKPEIDATTAAIAEGKKKAEELKPSADPLKAELAKAKEALVKAQDEVKAAVSSRTAAETLLAKETAKIAANKTKAAELRKKLPETTKAAQAAKVAAEKEAVTLAKQLEAAKTKAEQAKATFESRWPAKAPTATAQAG